MRHAHYWKRAGAKSAPSEIVCVDTETWHGAKAECEGGEWHTLRLGCAIAYRLEHGKRTRLKRITFTNPADFWELVKSRLSKQRPVWVFAHNAAYDLGVLNGWGFIQSPDVEVHKAAVTGQLLYLSTKVDGLKLVFADTLNYYRCSLKELGRCVGIEKSEMPEQECTDSEWAKYCMQDVEVTAGGVDNLIEFTRKHGLGPWQPSIAGLAFSAFRSCFMKDKVLVHDDGACLKLERDCYYGGLVECAAIGQVRASPIYELDVCSMYPAVCREPLPIYKKGYSERIGLEFVRKNRKKFMFCGDVTLETTDTAYPVKLKDGTYYPTGRFRTCLPHPELMQALDTGHIKWVHRLSWYTHAPIFKTYMEFFAEKKIAYSKPDTKAMRTLCKYYMNNLYGKTGQMSPKWLEWGPEALELLEEKYALKPGTLVDHYLTPPDLYHMEEVYKFREIPEPIDMRAYYGIVELKVGEYESRDSCPAIAATVTSYARLLLRGFQKAAGVGHWFYSDTDSVWVDDIGRANLVAAGCVKDDTLGYLTQASEHERLTVYGAKDYETEKVRKLKGIRPRATPANNGGWTQLHFPSAAAQIKSGRTGGVFITSVTKRLKREVKRCVLLPSGLTRPLVFPQENPEVVAANRCASARTGNRNATRHGGNRGADRVRRVASPKLRTEGDEPDRVQVSEVRRRPFPRAEA